MSDERDFTGEDNDVSGYVGVSPEYRNYANETERALLTDAERERLQRLGLQPDVPGEADAAAKEAVEAERKSDEDESDENGSADDRSGKSKSDESGSELSPPVKVTPVKSTGRTGR